MKSTNPMNRLQPIYLLVPLHVPTITGSHCFFPPRLRGPCRYSLRPIFRNPACRSTTSCTRSPASGTPCSQEIVDRKWANYKPHGDIWQWICLKMLPNRLANLAISQEKGWKNQGFQGPSLHNPRGVTPCSHANGHHGRQSRACGHSHIGTSQATNRLVPNWKIPKSATEWMGNTMTNPGILENPIFN
jgi:hypothetical protein